MSYQDLFQRLWQDYSDRNPQARRIHQLLIDEGETIINDHIALRTFDDKRVNIDVLAEPFIKCGYVECGEYQFPIKKLYAKHFEHNEDANAPKVFISELKCGEFSGFIQDKIQRSLDQIPSDLLQPEALLFAQRPWPTLSYKTYQSILDESEYAAWMLAYGYCANHFTINVNQLKRFNTLEILNQFITDHGYKLNTSGGVIKGSPTELLEQSSTLAEVRPLSFSDGEFDVPSCYYEFAKRYPQANGKLYTGFIAASADKIFESTNVNS